MPKPSLNTLIHEEVIGADPPLDYSTDISAAWTIVESLRERGMHVYLDGDRYNGDWRVVVYSKPKSEIAPCYWDGFEIANVTARTAPLAICLGALEAVNG